MKNLFLITLLSLFMVNASYAQDCEGGDENEGCDMESASQSSEGEISDTESDLGL